MCAVTPPTHRGSMITVGVFVENVQAEVNQFLLQHLRHLQGAKTRCQTVTPMDRMCAVTPPTHSGSMITVGVFVENVQAEVNQFLLQHLRHLQDAKTRCQTVTPMDRMYAVTPPTHSGSMITVGVFVENVQPQAPPLDVQTSTLSAP